MGQKITSKTGEPINLYGKQLSGTDIALFSRSSNVFGMLSSDDPFEYFGGISLAVRNLDGASPDMVVSNLRDANNAKAEDASRFLARELRTRIFHPRWIKEMQKEGYSGAVSLSSRMDNFFGWQVVDPNLVRSDQWDEYLDIYVDDKLNLDLDEWFEKTNPEALARMMQRMLEAQRKDYWQANDERLETLVKRYSEFVEKYNLFVDNEKLKQHVTKLAAGYGLAAPQFSADASQVKTEPTDLQPPKAAESSTGEVEQVTGQKLELQPQATESEPDYSYLFSILGVVLIILGGMYYEVIKGKMLMARKP
ncbi:cobaltochelatase subunit CobN [Psychrosphaera algicola]|uniref:Cobaltochelatase subunit CobN n=1 Tax=Psychrosphaera algicola TaxID=3023714 RepID=A0ABT5FJC1_9GAMM|nr:cobaltochelatase subunit CobN [Psychrosphaera sp. G1-22]MDC2891299.1 cobaltochelatase subunit CobN [Psychrosphaera sp. G1-22]